MGFNIKNNFGPNIDNHDGGVVNLYQDKGARWKVDAEDAVVIEENRNYKNTSLSDSRQAILGQLMDWADDGDWVEDITAGDIKAMLGTVLGVGEISLTSSDAQKSATLWDMLEKGRGNDRVKITWQNLVGYFADRKLFNKNGSPSLNKDFFGTNKDYSNIDKGRPSNDKNMDNMPPRFREILPLLDKYVPKLKG